MHLNEIEQIALFKALSEDGAKKARTKIAPGTHKVDMMVHVSGTIDVNPSETYIPTANIPHKAAMALLIRRMGFQRDEALKMLAESMKEALTADEKAESYVQALADLTEAEKLLQSTLEELPKATKAGKMKCALAYEKMD